MNRYLVGMVTKAGSYVDVIEECKGMKEALKAQDYLCKKTGMEVVKIEYLTTVEESDNGNEVV